MLESIIVLLVIVGVVFMVLSFYWGSLMFSITTLVIWMGLSIAVFEVEVPYTVITSGDVVVTGTQEINSLWMYSWFFIALAVVMFIHIIYIVFDMVGKHEKKIM